MSQRWEILENRTLGEKVYRTLPQEDGPALYVFPKEGYSKKYAIFSTRFGSIDNHFLLKKNGHEEKVKVPDGVAHFLEHKLFDEEEGNVFDIFASYGASPNAFTSFTNTTYLFSCTDYFSENFKLLLDFVQNPYFTEESVEKEKGIIQQEIRMYQDNPDWRAYFNLLSALYSEHPVRNDIAGSIESINQITKDILYKCYHTFYHPANMAIFAAGDLDPDEVYQLAVESLAEKKEAGSLEIERLFPEEKPEIHEREMVSELSVSQPIINIGFKDPYSYLEGRALLFRDLVTEVLLEMLFGKSEALFNRFYEEGLVDERFSAGFVAENTYGYTLVGGKTKDPARLHQEVLKGIKEAQQSGLDKESFARHKRKLKGHFLRSFNSLEFIANNYLSYRFRGVDFFELIDVLDQIQLEDVEKRLEEHLREELHALSIVKPVEER